MCLTHLFRAYLLIDIPPPSPPPPEDDICTPPSPKNLVTELALQQQIEARKNRSKKNDSARNSANIATPVPSKAEAASSENSTASDVNSRERSEIEALRSEMKAFAKLEIDAAFVARQQHHVPQPSKRKHTRRQSKDTVGMFSRNRSRSSSTVSTVSTGGREKTPPPMDS